MKGTLSNKVQPALPLPPVPKSRVDALPHYDEWRKMAPDDAARIIARHRGWSAEMEGLLAALLETFPPQPMKTPADGGENTNVK